MPEITATEASRSFADLLDAVEATATPPDARAVPRLEHVQVAGALLSGPLARRAERLLGVVPTYLYGSTECVSQTFDATTE